MNAREGLTKYVVRMFATEFVRISYRGLMAREPDPDGLSAYSAKLKDSGDYIALLRELCLSDEHWLRTASERATDVVRELYLGLLEREPEPEALNSYAAWLAESHDVPSLLVEITRSSEYLRAKFCDRAREIVLALHVGLLDREPSSEELQRHLAMLGDCQDLPMLLREILGSEEHWEKTVESRAPELVQAIYAGLLDRQPTSAALAETATRLAETRDLSALLADISRSDECWERTLEARAPELVQALYRGILNRNPDPDSLERDASKLVETHDLSPLLAQITRSEELGNRAFNSRAPELVRAIFRGLLNREPEPEALERWATTLTESQDPLPLLRDLARSDEFWEMQLSARAPDVIQSIYRGLLERDADPPGLQAYSKILAKTKSISRIVSELAGSHEFIGTRQKRMVVFLHVQKTAGTSLQAMLRDTFGKEAYLEHADTLGAHTPSALSAYSVFAGHFNHDSLRAIPCRNLSIFTFVREPKERLISQYYFWRAHEPTAPGWGGGQKLANDYLIEDFFARKEVGQSNVLWNHMTWVIMGQRQWVAWRTGLVGAGKEGVSDWINTTARPAIRQRLREFAFVGLQKDFERSIDMLCEVLKWPRFRTVRSEHGIERLAQKFPHFKKDMDKQPMTERLDFLLDECVQIDNVVYEEAEMLYAERLEQFSAVRGPGKRPHNRREAIGYSASDLRQDKLILFHLPRTGGTALHKLLLPQFGREVVWPERRNSLQYYAAGDLARYRYYSGYFDLPSINLIPGRKQIITLLREPGARLLSFYNHQHAHKPEVIERQGFELASLANRYSPCEFFRLEEVRRHPAINNPLVRTLTQTNTLDTWEARADKGATRVAAPLDMALAIRELESLNAFGISERYSESVQLILSTLGMSFDSRLVGNVNQEVNVASAQWAQTKSQEPIPEDIGEALSELIVQDVELYQHALVLFEKKLTAAAKFSSRAKRVRKS